MNSFKSHVFAWSFSHNGSHSNGEVRRLYYKSAASHVGNQNSRWNIEFVISNKWD